jgi:dienelactone hydrolase
VEATDWLTNEPETRNLNIGYFGARTGGGAALLAGAGKPSTIGAVVSRGGRLDLAGEALPLVKAPTLLIVGGRDEPVIEMNERAQAQLRTENRLEIVPGATPYSKNIHLVQDERFANVLSNVPDFVGGKGN